MTRILDRLCIVDFPFQMSPMFMSNSVHVVKCRNAGRRSSESRPLLDEFEVTPEEREAIAERLRRRRLERKIRRNPMKDRKRSSGSSSAEEEYPKVDSWEGEWSSRNGQGLRSEDDPYLGWGTYSGRGGGDGDNFFEEQGEVFEEGAAKQSKTFTSESTFEDVEDDGFVRQSRGEEFENPPDIALLNPQEIDQILPVLPFAAQADFFNGGAAQSVQRWGASLALTVVLSKVALLAATSLTWPLWWPWAKAAKKNLAMRQQMEYGGIWRTKLLEVSTSGRPRPSMESSDKKSYFSTMKTTNILIGDENGAQTEVSLPYDARYRVLSPGQAAEVVVLSDSPSFVSFKAVKDIYLPETGLWLSEYPYVDRAEFLEISLEIEREAMMYESYNSTD